jgi:hypothetical protein
MASDAIITITGLAEVQAMLRDAPRHIVVSGFARAGRDAANVFEAELAVRTPVRTETLWNDETFSEFRNQTGGGLRASVVSTVEVDAQGRGVHTQTGFGKQGHVAAWVEFGHRMVTHKPKKREVGFVPAHPFIRPAFEASGDRAIDVFARSLTRTVKEEYGS